MYYYDSNTDEYLSIQKNSDNINNYCLTIRLFANSIDSNSKHPLCLEQKIYVEGDSITNSQLLASEGSFNEIYGAVEHKKVLDKISIGMISYFSNDNNMCSKTLKKTILTKDDYYMAFRQLAKQSKLPVNGESICDILLPSLDKINLMVQYNDFESTKIAFEEYRQIVNKLMLPLREKTYAKDAKLLKRTHVK